MFYSKEKKAAEDAGVKRGLCGQRGYAALTLAIRTPIKQNGTDNHR
jgi:hypothetical protein